MSTTGGVGGASTTSNFAFNHLSDGLFPPEAIPTRNTLELYGELLRNKDLAKGMQVDEKSVRMLLSNKSTYLVAAQNLMAAAIEGKDAELAQLVHIYGNDEFRLANDLYEATRAKARENLLEKVISKTPGDAGVKIQKYAKNQRPDAKEMIGA